MYYFIIVATGIVLNTFLAEFNIVLEEMLLESLQACSVVRLLIHTLMQIRRSRAVEVLMPLSCSLHVFFIYSKMFAFERYPFNDFRGKYVGLKPLS